MMIELFVYILPKIISWAMGGMHVSLLGEYGSDGFDSHGVMALVDLCQAGETWTGVSTWILRRTQKKPIIKPGSWVIRCWSSPCCWLLWGLGKKLSPEMRNCVPCEGNMSCVCWNVIRWGKGLNEMGGILDSVFLSEPGDLEKDVNTSQVRMGALLMADRHCG